MTLDDWLAHLASAAGDRVTLDPALVAGLADALGVDEPELLATLQCLLDFHAGTATAYEIRSGTGHVDLVPAVARAAVFGAITTTVLRHLGAGALPAGTLSAVASLLFAVERAELTASELVVHGVLGTAGTAPQDLATLHRALPPDVRAGLTVAELADVVARLDRAGLARWRGGEVVLRPAGGLRTIRLVCREPAPAVARSGPKVFISYAHDDDGHEETVRTLAELLVRNGIDADMDQWAGVARQDWQAWATNLIANADFVLVVASPAYRRAGDGFLRTNDNRGVQAESATIRDLLHRNRHTYTAKLLPVVLPGHSIDEIPLFLQPYCADRYHVDELTDAGLEDLVRVLTGQPRYVRPALGSVPRLPPRSLPPARP
ncbi:toll/interleukin-1 receptor domain-containing protein [Amycolatopsis sp. CA-128772]|uniref:toll/interleukin-1 receptor domain-containing protein n=1 Tax=Amycolatopsis sp. CA-128772 TaxID=2073159 RepID=UPI0011B075F9|nr:toll/interleukin-1 receptor domain-containing protein [Amycolatopsis sp. CA-128772]